MKVTVIALIVFMMFSQVGFCANYQGDIVSAEVTYEVQSIGSLQLGDRVVDKSWDWEYKTGKNYSGTGENKPVTWIIVAKNHYDVDDEQSHVTLLSEELIGYYDFDDSSNRGHVGGSNHWGESGTYNGTHGIRPFLNSFDKNQGYSYTGNGFYNAFNDKFKSYILNTKLPNKEWSNGNTYNTLDKVFIPSTTELGDINHYFTYEIGEVYPYFDVTDDEKRIAEFNGKNGFYWTRSPEKCCSYNVRYIRSDGDLDYDFDAVIGYHSVRPALNILSDTLVYVNPDDEGVYLIVGDEKNGEDYDDVTQYGDVTGTGSITVVDAVAVLRHIVGIKLLNEDELIRARVSDNKGEISVQDVILILRYVVGIINIFPVEERDRGTVLKLSRFKL